MAVCMDDMVMQLMLAVLVIDHLAVDHQGLDACDEILWVLSRPGHNIFKFYEAHMGVDVMCHSLVYSVEEGRRGFGSQGHKNILEVVLTVRHNVVEEEPVLQGMPKYGERVVCIFQVPVVDGQADGCGSSHKCTSNGIGCGLVRLSDQLLWGQF